jgi:Tfp pilus assembly protein PilO
MAVKLSQKQQQTIVLIVMLVVGGGWAYWNYMLKPTFSEIKEKKSRLEKLKNDIAKAERQARRLPALKHEKEKLSQELEKLEKQLPRGKDVPNIIRTISREAIQENLIFQSLDPQANTQRNFFEIIPFKISMKGELNSLVRFLSSLGQGERIFKAENFTFAPIGSSEEMGIMQLNIGFTLLTYAYTGG